jgi:hypothetical protein
MMIGEVTKCLRSRLEGDAGAAEVRGPIDMDAATPGVE